ncbi:MAG TPA: Fmu (Sun) domain-containing protein [Chitinophagaceae bacterium]|nr:Fmu (Sun) domain-containing protein [Chitinophagaceae bacterium]
MSRYYSYLNTATTILAGYRGEEAFALFLKKFFSSHKKYGSRDRKFIGHLCYCFFRMGKMENGKSVEEKILKALFLCSDQPNELLTELRPEWSDKVRLPVQDKFPLFDAQQSILDVFPWKEELSNGIDYEKFCESFFHQPDLFLRVRPGRKEEVVKSLKDAGIAFEIINDHCLALPNGSKIDEVIELNKEAVVQDYSSQRVAEFIELANLKRADRVWDCCAASGGKSIMLHDVYPGIDLTVSDKRQSIIVNLEKRFSEAGIRKYKSIVADLATEKFVPMGPGTPDARFEFIICDVPCSGSGTWSRTPEQLYYFEKKKIDEYASLQKRILSNVIPHLQPAGHLLYITCSVFKKENEEAVNFIQQQNGLRLVDMQLLKGYDKKADTMFAALLQKTL